MVCGTSSPGQTAPLESEGGGGREDLVELSRIQEVRSRRGKKQANPFNVSEGSLKNQQRG